MTMNPKTREALEASIAHWEENERAEAPPDATLGADFCALCDEFQKNPKEGGECFGCPVFEKTKAHRCQQTPYRKAAFAWKDWECGLGTRDAFRAACRAEIAFLKSLLPEKTDA